MLFCISLFSCLYLALWSLTLPLQPRCEPSLLSDSPLCCSQAVKHFDCRTKAVPGLKECCLGQRQGWRRSCGPLILVQTFCDWRAKGLLSMGSFPIPTIPEDPSSAEKWSCLHLLTKRCHKLFKSFVSKS